MDIFSEIAIRIIKEQELIIGPLAWIEASKVSGLQVANKEVIFVDEDKRTVIDRLVSQYQRLFGNASKEVCRSAVSKIINRFSSADIPVSLQ